jgi:hypothetical protein
MFDSEATESFTYISMIISAAEDTVKVPKLKTTDSSALA